ncbi:formate/nitrite family of transporter [Oceaniovalibus guishaninsula JLT2003]|uniref:Formate/nitrite family of transporter n=1 Tax=Oceaniovalibus guishaninsula JLT2003 TaxID=1231392 RepID=K2HCM8_9RHOB|nr:formate/nitrite transporter family protein [Oceaniovalibus guishaninsula]EKE45138.1 formate/nitrite family of transporter [Oceaniovalibus guishaninsula JLT2003]
MSASDEAKKNGSATESEEEEASVNEAGRLTARLIYEVVRRDGLDEMSRPVMSLTFSALAAGILIAFSVLGEAVFRTHLPEHAAWSGLVQSLGYSFGFVLVILGRMQLFTENTISTVLPLMAGPSRHYFICTARLWAIVLSCNVAGCFVAALFIAYSGGVSDDLVAAVRAISEHATSISGWTAFARAIPAGVLIAALVWMLPALPHNGLLLIVMFTWLISVGDFAHVVAGSVEMAFLMVTGHLGVAEGFVGFWLPVLAGNFAGGTAVFTLITWAQVKSEVRDDA